MSSLARIVPWARFLADTDVGLCLIASVLCSASCIETLALSLVLFVLSWPKCSLHLKQVPGVWIMKHLSPNVSSRQLFLTQCVYIYICVSVFLTLPRCLISYHIFMSTDGKEEARKQNATRPAERWIPGASRETEALLQNSERIQRGKNSFANVNHPVFSGLTYALIHVQDFLIGLSCHVYNVSVGLSPHYSWALNSNSGNAFFTDRLAAPLAPVTMLAGKDNLSPNKLYVCVSKWSLLKICEQLEIGAKRLVEMCVVSKGNPESQ